MSDETVIDVPAVPGPGVAGQDPHSHPLPGGVRVLLVIFGLGLGVMFLLLLILIGGQDERSAAQVAEAKRQVMAELDERTEARDRTDAERDERARLAFCTVIGESFQPTEAIAELSMALGCPVDAAGQPVPETEPPDATARPGPSPAPGTAQKPEQGPSSSEGAEPDTQPRQQPPSGSRPSPSSPPPPPDDPDDEPPGPLPPVTCTVPVVGPTICS